MDAGIPVYAAADGTVESVADGNFDRNTEWAGQPANFVIINHGSGWKTNYYHLSVNTVAVKVGDVVTAGQFLGLVGSSGISTGAHLHFEILHHGASVESYYDPASYYQSPTPYQADLPTVVKDMGVTNYIPTEEEFLERPADHTLFSTATSQTVLAWFRFTNFKMGEQFQYNWYRPDGTLHNSNVVTVASDRRGGWYYWSRNISTLATYPGKWRVAIVKNGLELSSREFEVTAGPGAPGIKVGSGQPARLSSSRITGLRC
jgi:murein DD-endopeptidase MepM/ murein hydrolase activator NlpD